MLEVDWKKQNKQLDSVSKGTQTDTMAMPSGYRKALSIAPKVTSLASILGSSMIISSVIRSKKNRHMLQQRIVLSMSIIDVIVSTTWFFSPLFVPDWSEDMHWTMGNQASCSTQGFIVQFSISSVVYNSALSLYYLLVIQFGWTEDRIRRLEPFIHIIAISWGLITATVALFLKLYNPANWDCWIAPFPPDCTQSFRWESQSNGNMNKVCDRGNNASIYQWAFFFAPLWTVILFVTGIMISVYRDVRSKELEMIRSRENKINLMLMKERQNSYGSSPASVGAMNDDASSTDRSRSYNADATVDSDNCMRYTREVFQQSVLYVGAFYCTWFFPTLTRIVQLFQTSNNRNEEAYISPMIILLSGIFIPIQGLLNAAVYFRPRLKVYKQTDPGITSWDLLRKTISSTLCCCISHGKYFIGHSDPDVVQQPPNYSLYIASSCVGSGLNEMSEVTNVENTTTRTSAPILPITENHESKFQE